MTNDAFQNTLANDQRLIENALQQLLPPTVFDQGEVVEAMRYSLMNGGKRLRPVLALEFCKACGGDRHAVLEPACALEYVHTYSLIHDDLPCMDDDDLRRGRPSCHKAYPENIALLAGDALLTHAFEIIADCELSADAKCQMVSLLAANAGVSGMIGGQVLDLKYEAADPSLQQLLTVHKLKTGALISAACIWAAWQPVLRRRRSLPLLILPIIWALRSKSKMIFWTLPAPAKCWASLLARTVPRVR